MKQKIIAINFNSIKVRLEQKLAMNMYSLLVHFNSIKVRLEPVNWLRDDDNP